MGTTQRIAPGVSGQPNWGDLNKSITNIAKTVEKENNDQDNATGIPEQIAKEYKRLIDRRNYHVKAAFKNLVKTGGGASAISKGRSASIGKAGLRTARKLTTFFSGVGSRGLRPALAEIGFGSLDGKTIQDVIDFLLVYCSDSNAGMDETAASKASCEVLDEIAAQADNNLDKFEEILKEYTQGNGLTDLVCRFWGLYIFEHLSQRFEEKITQQRGESVSKETFRIIKDDILGQVKVLNEQRPISQINWHGTDGERTIETIFESIIKIICDDTD